MAEEGDMDAFSILFILNLWLHATMPLRRKRSFGSSALGLLGTMKVIGTLHFSMALPKQSLQPGLFKSEGELMDPDDGTLKSGNGP